ncbi:hypothetical protein HOY82DRAFT_563560 [Tuber indicum]|nr:hypothetical protein HOY82DRAFT_563560 [Tuber indicum]
MRTSCHASAKATCSRRQLFNSLNSKSTLAHEISMITQDPPPVLLVRKIAWEDGNNMNLPRVAGRFPFNYYFYILYQHSKANIFHHHKSPESLPVLQGVFTLTWGWCTSIISFRLRRLRFRARFIGSEMSSQ